ncbi:MAG: hypothetical protein CMF52_01895 [Legionellales bacterium]|nr:hypothetical protein [Legionellales bacterium]HAV93532.1 hypothetical protein [Pseudomonadota bacterium]|tara:strand:+ start:1034 stop:2419 length:1386 start_codon:yes stop_codon:yes gene_type:complete
MKARYVVGFTLVTLFSVVSLANYYYETAPSIDNPEVMATAPAGLAKKPAGSSTQSSISNNKQIISSLNENIDSTQDPDQASVPTINNVATKGKTTATGDEIFTVHREAHKDDRSYRSSINPVVKSIVTSPVKGKIGSAPKKYGDHVKKGDMIVGITSDEARNELLSETVNYITNRDNFHNSYTEVQKNTELHQKGIVSKQELRQSESAYIRAMIEMVRARIQLKNISQRLDFDWKSVENLGVGNNTPNNKDSKTDFAIEKLLGRDFVVNIHADNDGILLPKFTGYGNVEYFDLNKGSGVPEREALGMIADTEHVKVKFTASEFDAMKLRVGQSVEVVISVANDLKLSGAISEINRFDFRERSGQAPGIPVTAQLKCGNTPCDQLYSMSADIKAISDTSSSILVPIEAVHEKDGQFFVMQVVNNQPVVKEVSTGETTRNMIIITSGLEEGDNIVRNYPTTKN